ncbi:hypothetical protein [Phenylobacterium sp.]|nr:hypothetical protein [Phenylobacterium sp.]
MKREPEAPPLILQPVVKGRQLCIDAAREAGALSFKRLRGPARAARGLA